MEDQTDSELAKRELFCPGHPDTCFLYSHGKGRRYQTFCTTLDNNTTYTKKGIPNLRHKIPLGTYYGWGLFFDSADRGSMILWNPLDWKTIELPRLELNKHISDIALSSAPSNPDCMIVLFAWENPIMYFCHIATYMHWEVVDYSAELRICLLGYEDEWWDNLIIRHPVFYNGRLFGMIHNHSSRLIAIDNIQRGSICIRSLDVIFSPLGLSCGGFMHLVECGGNILAINLFTGGVDIREIIGVQVYRLNFVELRWDKVQSIKDFVFFFGNDSCFSCPAVATKNNGGRVYFSLDRTNLQFYDIEEGSIEMFPAQLAKQRSRAIWFVPQNYSVHEVKSTADSDEDMDDLQLERLEEEIEREAYIFKLHSGIIELIAKPLILDDYCRFRATCKEFRSTLPPVYNLDTAVIRRQETNLLHPWFVYFENDTTYSIFDPLHGERYRLRVPAWISGCKVSGSKDGWLLLTGITESTFFFNPFTMRIMALPTRPYHESMTVSFGVSSSPSTSQCLVVQICMLAGRSVNYVQVGQMEWLSEIYGEDDDTIHTVFKLYDNSPVYYKDSFYCLGANGKLGLLQFGDNQFPTWQLLLRPHKPCKWYEQLFLVECEGELLSVCVGYSGVWVRVFKLDQSNMSWIMIDSLGSHLICISRSSSFALAAQVPEMRNKIFFPRFFRGNIVYYSLDTEQFHSLDGKDSVVDYRSTKEHLYCGWVERANY